MSVFSVFMFGAACLQSVSGIRNEDVENLLLGEGSSTPKVMTSVTNAIVRGCVEDLAVKHAELTKEANVDNRMDELNAALLKAFETEDQKLDKSTFATRRADATASKQVSSLGFSLRVATKHCNSEIDQPFNSVVQDCILSIAESGETRAWGWKGWMYRKGVASKEVVTAEGNLTELLMQRLSAEDEIKLLSTFSTRSYMRKVETLIHWRKAKVKAADIAIKSFEFKLPATRSYCETLHEEETMASSQWILDQTSEELSMPAARIDGVCQEVPGMTCPAGTSPQVSRHFNSGTTLTVMTGTNIAFRAIVQPMLFAAGTLIGGPALGAQLFLSTSIPGIANIVGIPLGLLAGIPFLGDCMCAMNECAYNETLKACAMTTSDTSTYEFQYLPYPGSRCIPSGGSPDAPECALSECADEDLSATIEDFSEKDSLYGKVGIFQSDAGAGTYNCLATSPDRMGQMAFMRKLPDPLGARNGEDAMVNNTQESRTSLYRALLDSLQ